jgi:hypothetical protein
MAQTYRLTRAMDGSGKAHAIQQRVNAAIFKFGMPRGDFRITRRDAPAIRGR